LEQFDVQDGLNNCSSYFDCDILLFGCKIVEDVVFATFVVESCFNFLNECANCKSDGIEGNLGCDLLVRYHVQNSDFLI
jgi:hypothetical protein